LVYIGAKGDTMNRFLINFFLWMIRAQVATATVIRVASLLGREAVSQVAGGAGPFGTIRINSANAGIGPAGGV